MNQLANAAQPAPRRRPISSDDLVDVLNRCLAACRGGRCVAEMRRRPGEYFSSHWLEELEVRLDDGTVLSILFKDLTPGSMLQDAARLKPPFLSNPAREAAAYQLLEAFGVEGPRCLGYHADPAAGRHFVFMEKVDGIPLWQSGDITTWQAAARWSAVAHGRLRPVGDAVSLGPLIDYSTEYFAAWPARARQFVVDRDTPDERAPALAALLNRYDEVIHRLASLPRTLIHGEFHASNILAHGSRDEPRIVPVDWEMAGVGPGLMDLADLISGNWSEAQRESLVVAYREALPNGAGPPGDEFSACLDACRLHKAIQWLGWAPDWSPPREHRTDWLDEALRLGARLGLI